MITETEESKRVLRKKIEKFDCEIDFYIFDQFESNVPWSLMVEKNGVAQIAYSKIFSPLILPVEIVKVLYLDTDLLIVNNLSNLFAIDLRESIAACQDAIDGQLHEEDRSFNSGVMVLNLDKMRKDWSWSSVGRAFEENLSSPWMDMTILRNLYGSDWYELPTSYNFIINGKAQKHFPNSNLSVIHFAGKPKPWDEVSDSFVDFYWKFFADRANSNFDVDQVDILDLKSDSFQYKYLNHLYHAIQFGLEVFSPHRDLVKLEATRMELEATRMELEATRMELEATIGSTIWKVFKPYRSIRKKFKGSFR